jgi:methylmalonyl-CoA mutase N-terminal domain/subunit
MKQIEDLGGSVAAIESGWIQAQIAEASWEYQRKIDEKEIIIVGVNEYTDGGEERPSIFQVDKRLVEHQLGRLKHHREARDPAAVAASLAALKEAAAGSANLMYPILDAVRAYATLGEICGAMREVFGEYQPPTVI